VTHWFAIWPGLTVSLALLYAPGALALTAARLRFSSALIAAPVVSIPVVLAAGIAAGRLGLTFDVLRGGGLVLGLTLAGSLAARLATRRCATVLTVGVGHRAIGAATAVSATAVWLYFAVGIPTPGQVNSLPDDAFHLGTAEWLRRHGSANVLDGAVYPGPTESGLSYPTTFHVFVSTIAMWTGLDISTATHAVLIALGAVVWPAGCALLAGLVVGRRGWVAAPISVMVQEGAFLYLTWGAAWPLYLAFTVLPIVLALLLEPIAEWRSRSGVPDWRRLGLLAIGSATVVVAHPSSVATVAFIGACMIGCTMPLPQAWARREVLARVVVTGILLALVAMVVRLGARPAMLALLADDPGKPLVRAAVEAVLVVIDSALPAIIWIVLFGVGFWLLRRQPMGVWVPVAWLVFLTIYLLKSVTNGAWIRAVTWIWWNDERRLKGVLTLLAVLAITAALLAVADRARSLALRRGLRRPGVVVLAVVLVVGALIGPSVRNLPRIVALGYGRPVETDALRIKLINPQRQAALESVARGLPADALVAADPRRGGSYLYALGGPMTVYPVWSIVQSSDLKLIGSAVDRVTVAAEVCAAVRRVGVTHVMVGGERDPWDLPWDVADYSGLQRAATHFDPVLTAGPYSVYRVPACQPG
jgi:hypothetical protein